MHKAPEAAGYGTFIVHMQCSNWSRILQVGAYAIASPLSAFIAFAIFKSQSQSAIDNPINLQTLNWWTGYTLLIAEGIQGQNDKVCAWVTVNLSVIIDSDEQILQS